MGVFQMTSVFRKAPTRRRALATGTLRMGPRAFALLRGGRLPKGDALKAGELAGIMAAKRACEALPLCHPLPLDQVSVRFELEPSLPGLRVFCEAAAVAPTGVEMEALSGAAGALLAVYDLVKPVDPALTVSDLRLEHKEGGKKGLWRHPEAKESIPKERTARSRASTAGRAVVITVSDRCSRGAAKDLSGPALRRGLSSLGLRAGPPIIVPDERPRIEAAVRRAAAKAEVVVLTGGTGLSPRDVTPEALAGVCERLIPGFGEAFRAKGAASTPLSALSRATAGQLGSTLVVALPGSAGGVADGLEVLAELLPHALHVARGGGHG